MLETVEVFLKERAAKDCLGNRASVDRAPGAGTETMEMAPKVRLVTGSVIISGVCLLLVEEVVACLTVTL